MENTKARKVIQTLQKAIQKKYPSLHVGKVRNVIREVAFAPQKRLVDLEDTKISASDLRLVLGQMIEFDAMFAQSIENLNCETSSDQEYFRWLNDTTKILKNMNDGYVTTEDLAERNEFLKFTYQRESELMLCLGLYQGCRSKQAQERAKFIRYKLQKLREMRASLEFLTKNESNVESLRSEYDAAVPYYKYFKNLQKLPFGYDMPYEQKQKLGISHDDDEDLQEDYNAYDDLVNDVLDIENEKFSDNSNDLKSGYKQTVDQTEKLSRREDLFHVEYNKFTGDN